MVNIWVNYLLLYKQQATETRSLSRLLVGYLLRICTNPVGGGVIRMLLILRIVIIFISRRKGTTFF